MDVPSTNINDLPNEILLKIFSYISVEDLGLNVQFVCSRWTELCLENVLWKNRLFIVGLQETPTDVHVLSFLEKVPKLQNVCILLKSAAQILLKLAENCKNLRKLIVCMGQESCNEAFRNVALECTKLEELNIKCCSPVSEEYVEVVGLCTNLHTISLSSISDKPIILKHIADGCPSLRHLDMRNMEWLYSDVKYFLEQKKSKLITLCISPVTKEGSCVVPLLAICKDSLQNLQLEDKTYCYIDSSTLSLIKTLHSLRSLSIRFPLGITADGMANIFIEEGLSHLLEIEISCVDLNTNLVQVICNNCPNLLRLELARSRYLNDVGLRYLCKCTKLEKLYLYDCPLLEDVMAHVSTCSNLKYLTIEKCGVKQKNLGRLIDLTELRELKLYACDAAGLPLDLFPLHLKKLRKLELAYCFNFDREILAVLQGKMPHRSLSPNCYRQGLAKLLS